jgi:hypothetical protein
MTFKVFAEAIWGRFSSSHETAEDALARAMQLMASCLTNVQIIDPDGRSFTPAEFLKRMDIHRSRPLNAR